MQSTLVTRDLADEQSHVVTDRIGGGLSGQLEVGRNDSVSPDFLRSRHVRDVTQQQEAVYDGYVVALISKPLEVVVMTYQSL